AAVTCARVGTTVVVTVTADPNCPCDTFQVVRDDGVVLAAGATPGTFVDPNPCPGPHTYTAKCVVGNFSSTGVPCTASGPQGCTVQDPTCVQEAGGTIRVKWSTSPANCCRKFLIRLFCDGTVQAEYSVLGSTTEVVIDDCPRPCAKQQVCIYCVDANGNLGD